MLDVTCPGCSGTFKVKDEHAGKKMKCPKCGKIVPIAGKADAEEFAEVEVIEDEPAAADEQFDFYDSAADAPKKKKKGVPKEERGKTWGKYMPCPACGHREAKRVKWTWWGSFYGPRMFTHVRCLECGYAFNGKTGDTNVIPATLFVIIPLILIVALLVFIYITLKRRGFI